MASRGRRWDLNGDWSSPLGGYVKGKEAFVQTIGEIVEIHSTFKVSAFGARDG